MLGSCTASSYRATVDPSGSPASACSSSPSVWPVSVAVPFGSAEGNGRSRSIDQPLLTWSTSKPSLSTRILPHESQLGGMTTLSLSMTLCLSGCFLRRECIPRLEWIRVGSWEETEGVV